MSLSIPEVPAVFKKIQKEVGKIIVGQHDIVEQIAIGLLCRSHVLLVGAPGLAKTTLVNCFANALHLDFNRIQFTPDLMPSDILGTEILQENRTTGGRELIFTKGPVFTNMLLADEINRTPPKTQAALLQAMQEKKVTVFGKTESLSEPFMVLATQNPIEQEGTYPLPEAQLDRFLFAIHMDYPDYEQELAIVKRHSSKISEKVEPVVNLEEILQLQNIVFDMTVSDHIYEYAVKLVRSTRPGDPSSSKTVRDYVRWGAGPRSIQYLILGAKAKALLDGRPTPTEADIDKLLFVLLNHRILLNFHAEADGITVESIISDLKANL